MEAIQAQKLFKEMEDFCSYKLRVLLDFNEVTDITARILELEESETRDFIRCYINAEKSRYKQVNAFITELLSMKRKYNALIEKDKSRIRVVEQMPLQPGTKVYIKERDNHIPPGVKKKRNQREKKQEKKQRQMENKETKFVRKYCDCQALRHPLINNCLRCGKIICALEGEGDCMFCGAQEAQTSQTSEQLEKATAHRDKLIKYGSDARANKVYDDQSDHFDYHGNQWLSDQEKTLLKQREEETDSKIKEEQRKIVITLDLAGRRIVQEEEILPQPIDDDVHPGGVTAGEETEKSVSLSFANQIITEKQTEPMEDEKDPYIYFDETERRAGAYKNPFLQSKAPRFRKSNSKKAKVNKFKRV